MSSNIKLSVPYSPEFHLLQIKHCTTTMDLKHIDKIQVSLLSKSLLGGNRVILHQEIKLTEEEKLQIENQIKAMVISRFVPAVNSK